MYETIEVLGGQHHVTAAQRLRQAHKDNIPLIRSIEKVRCVVYCGLPCEVKSFVIILHQDRSDLSCKHTFGDIVSISDLTFLYTGYARQRAYRSIEHDHDAYGFTNLKPLIIQI